MHLHVKLKKMQVRCVATVLRPSFSRQANCVPARARGMFLAFPFDHTTPPHACSFGVAACHPTCCRRLQMEEERLAIIERDNRRLLQNMAKIMRTAGSVDHRNFYEHKRCVPMPMPM